MGSALQRWIAAALLAVSASPSAGAEPATVGEMHLAGDLFIPHETNPRACESVSGVTLRITIEDPTAPGKESYIAIVERHDADGSALAPIVIESPMPIRYWGEIACASDGSFVVALRTWSAETHSKARLVRAFESSGNPRGPFFSIPDDDQHKAPIVALHGEAGIFQVWQGPDEETRAIYGQWLGLDGEAASAPVRLGRKDGASQSAIAFDDAANTIVAWIEWEQDCWRVSARVVDAAGVALGQVLRLSGPSCSYPRALHAAAIQDGVFRVTWHTQTHGGRVGRHVSIDPDAYGVPSTTTTTLPASDEVAFHGARSLGTTRLENWWRPISLTSDGEESWLAAWNEIRVHPDYDDEYYAFWVLASSDDAGRTWNRLAPPYWNGRPVVAMGSNGTWMLGPGHSDDGIDLLVSRDRGATWIESIVAPWCTDDGDVRCADIGLTIATDGHGGWAVAWQRLRWHRNDEAQTARSVMLSMSHDDGETWTGPRALWTNPSSGILNVAVAGDGDGNWMVAWQEEREHRIQVARSIDDGATWAEPVAALDLSDKRHTNYDAGWRESMSLVHVDREIWLVSFASGQIDVARYGADGDIFVVRTDDGGESWSEPLPINAYAGVDAGTDSQPSIAAGSGGAVAALWRSHDPLGGPLEDSSDVAAAYSSDGGLTWSWPRSVDASSPDILGQGYPVVTSGSGGRWVAAWHQWPNDRHWDEADHTIRLASAPILCGDGVIQAAEQCDDANDIDGDGCDTDCGFTTCGNGIVTAGEECDDGNPLDDDDCLPDCRLAVCGDGVVHATDEECDDAATTTTGSCLPDCTFARCGDGFVAPDEECDDGNFDDDDECTHACGVPVCGDGILRPSTEECDDGNDSNGDACVEGCRHATCGDGFVWRGVEECEPVGPADFHACTHDCRWLRACGDGSAASVTSTAALSVLRFAVGLPSACTVALCDADGNGRVTTNDALYTLRSAVASVAVSNCTEELTVRFELDDARALGTLQFRARHRWFAGSFVMDDGKLRCTLLHPSLLYALNTSAPNEVRAAFITVRPVAGPFPLLECRFRHPHGVVLKPRDVRIEIEDSVGEDLQTLVPPPRIRVRVLD